MFSTFPDGIPGLGLVILRFVLGGVLTISVLGALRDRHDWGIVTASVVILMLTSGLLIITGYRTRPAAIAAMVAIIGDMISLTSTHSLEMVDTRAIEVLGIMIALSVACLGPGAFSLDSRLFGRREIVIPKSSPGN
jgi:uncharacterized membrane protein YphA (DoxX/SURF4 family)